MRLQETFAAFGTAGLEADWSIPSRGWRMTPIQLVPASLGASAMSGAFALVIGASATS